MAPMPPQPTALTRPATSYWMLEAENMGLSCADPLTIREPALHSTLAVVRLLTYMGVHSKRLLAYRDVEFWQSPYTTKRRAFRVFSCNLLIEASEITLDQGLVDYATRFFGVRWQVGDELVQ